MGYKKIASPVIQVPKRDGMEVKYPVSYKYNGGIVIDGKWYDGFKVGKPIVPEGFKLMGIGCGLQFNSIPPEATARLVRECPKISLLPNPFSQVQQL